MNESKENTDLRNESLKDSNQQFNSKSTLGEKKMDKTNAKETNIKFNQIEDLLDEEIIPNKSLITQYNRKKNEAKKLKVRLVKLTQEVKILGDRIKGIGGVA